MSLSERGKSPAGAGRLHAAQARGALPGLGQQVSGGAVVLRALAGRRSAVALMNRAGAGRRRRSVMMVGVGGGAPRPHVRPAAVVVVEIVVIVAAAAAAAAAASAGIAAVEFVGRIDGLHGDLGPGLGRGVEGLRPGVVLGPELNGRLHGDLGLLGKAVAAVGRRGAAVARWGSVVRRRGGVIGWGRAVTTPVCPVHVQMRLDLDHVIGTGAEERIQRGIFLT